MSEKNIKAAKVKAELGENQAAEHYFLREAILDGMEERKAIREDFVKREKTLIKVFASIIAGLLVIIACMSFLLWLKTGDYVIAPEPIDIKVDIEWSGDIDGDEWSLETSPRVACD